MEWHSSENRKWKPGQWFPPLLRCLSNEFKCGGAIWMVCYWPVRKVKWFGIIAKRHFIIGLFSQVLWCFLFQVGQYCSDLNVTGWEVLFALFQGGWEYIRCYCRNLSHQFFLKHDSNLWLKKKSNFIEHGYFFFLVCSIRSSSSLRSSDKRNKKDQSWKSWKQHCFQHWTRLAAALVGLENFQGWRLHSLRVTCCRAALLSWHTNS